MSHPRVPIPTKRAGGTPALRLTGHRLPSFLLGWLFLASLLSSLAEVTPLAKLAPAEQQARLAGDLKAVQVYRDGLRSVMTYIAAEPELFPPTRLRAARLLPREQKEKVWNTWRSFLEYQLALESLGRYHAGYLLLTGEAEEDSFLVCYAAALAQYRHALDFIARAENDPGFDTLLNEPVPEIGLSRGTFDKLKFRFLHVGRATEFAASEVVFQTFTRGRAPTVRATLREDAEAVWKMGRGKGQLLTAKNAFDIVLKMGGAAWLPIQAGVSEWMGDTKVLRPNRSLISPEQIERVHALLQPGDILIERRDWYLSNVGLPGYWPHAALYLGTAEERRKYFDDAEVRAWLQVQGAPDFEALLRAKYPVAYTNSTQPQEHGHLVRVMEAMSEGVSFTTLEHSADCDSLAVLRPRLGKRERAVAILRAFHYAGRPYDFNFDFATDAEIVCTELVYKAYEPATGFTGLRFPLVEILGRKVLPANEMVRQFDAASDTPEQQLDLLLFLDARERENRAVESTLAEFRASWKRPKWHVLVQGLPGRADRPK